MSDTAPRSLREPAAGPADVVVEIDAGRIEILLAGESGPETEPHPGGGPGEPGEEARPGEVRATVEHDPSTAPPWVDGIAGVLGWLDRRLGEHDERLGAATDDRVTRALEAVELRWEDPVLTVRGPRDPELRTVPLTVRVWAPDMSSLRVAAGAAPVTASGRAGATEISTTGAVALEETGGRTALRCGAGKVRIGRATAHLTCSSGAGEVDVRSLGGPGEITTGAGAVRLGVVTADVAVRVGSGDVTVDDATAGDLDLTTGAGSVRVGVHRGVDAKVDLRARAGRASTDLELRDRPPAGETPLRIRGRSAAGDTRVVGATHG